MKRKIYDRLLEWKNNRQGEVALLIEGARRIGKSYIVEEFARNEYESYILIDFNKVEPRVKRWFSDYMEDLDTFFEMLQQHIVYSDFFAGISKTTPVSRCLSVTRVVF